MTEYQALSSVLFKNAIMGAEAGADVFSTIVVGNQQRFEMNLNMNREISGIAAREGIHYSANTRLS